MSIDFERWVEEYEGYYKEKKFFIKYKNNGEIVKEYSPYFESISQVLQERGFLLKEEFISICKWKTKRQKEKYQENSEEDIREITKSVIRERQNIETQISSLTKLNGVGVPVASAILTVIFPESYCVVDYRAWKSLLWVVSEPFDCEDYSEFSEIIEKFLRYVSLDSCKYYIEKIRVLSHQYNMTPRKIEMALWMYDKRKGILNE